jgi:type I restriction enzyme S subunit
MTMADNKDKKVLKVPDLRFPEFTDEWERKKFRDVCNITTGNKNTQDKSNDGIYPFYVRSQIVERINSWTFDGEAILTAGDGVGVGKVFHYSTGKIGVHQRVYILSDFKCDGKYLYSYFAGHFYNRVKRMSAKNSVDSVRMEMIADMPISLPSTEEQKKIGHLLALLDERIATQTKIIERYKSLIRGINQYAFTNTGINYKLGEICEIRSGYSGNQLTLKNGLKVSRIETISEHKVNMERVGYVAPFESSENYRLQIGDILFSNINSVEYIGNTAFIDKDYNLYHGMNLLRLIPKKELVIPFYLYLVLNTNRLLNHFKTVCNKAVSQASINQTELGKTIVLIPNLMNQNRICELFQTLYTKLEAERYFISLLQGQKQHLLRQMFI